MFVFGQLNLEGGKACGAQHLKILATPDKIPPEKPLVELTEVQNEAYALWHHCL